MNDPAIKTAQRSIQRYVRMLNTIKRMREY